MTGLAHEVRRILPEALRYAKQLQREFRRFGVPTKMVDAHVRVLKNLARAAHPPSPTLPATRDKLLALVALTDELLREQEPP